MKTVKFRKLIDGDTEDYEFLEECELIYASKVGERLLETLEKLETAMSGFQVTRLEHCLQTATRAFYDGADTDWIVSALLHDIGDIHSPYDHDEYAALILRPFVREQCAWAVEKHGVFQKLYYAAQMGKDPNVRDRYRDNPYFDDCADFCERWDQEAFDPTYQSLPLDFFRPMVAQVFARAPYDAAVIRAGERVPLVDSSIAQSRLRAA